MATSGTYTFGRNRDQLIKAAARKVSAIEAGETPDSDTVADFAEALNAMVKHWQADGLHIWTMAEATLFLQTDQTSYLLGTSAADHATESYVETTISADEASGQTVISVTSVTGMTAADNIGIQVDDGTIHWTTISSVGATTVTTASALDDSAASGNLVIVYTSKAVRPLAITSARRYNFDSDIETPIMVESRADYFDLPNKTATGTPNIVFYDRRGGANSTGKLYVWQPEDPPADAIKYTFKRPIQDFNAAGDDPDLPQEWIRTLIWNLALEMAPEYDVPEQKIQRIERMADKSLAQVSWYEQELGAISFVPDMRR
jgi:hypothetical protein